MWPGIDCLRQETDKFVMAIVSNGFDLSIHSLTFSICWGLTRLINPKT
jgi:hypothetical protein